MFDDVSFDDVIIYENIEDLIIDEQSIQTVEDSSDVSFNDVSSSDPWLDPLGSGGSRSLSEVDYSESLQVLSDQLDKIENDFNFLIGFTIICVIYSFARRLVSHFSFKGRDIS